MQCPRCQQDNPLADAQFCPRCGAPTKHAEEGATAAASYADLHRELAEAREQLTAAHAQVSESHEQQAATAEILRVISSSPTDVQPVFDVIVENACRLCEGVFANVVRFDGKLMHNMAQYGFTLEAQEVVLRFFPAPPTRGSMSGRAILSGTVVYAEDASSDDELSVSRQLSELLGFRAQVSLVAVPMLRGEEPIGAISVGRRGPQGGIRPFTDSEIALLKTFADQAVIAIENVRLFKETKEALEQQTATADILRVISSSPTDIQPVLDTLVRSAARFVGAYDAAIHRVLNGDRLELVAHYGPIPYPIGRVIPLARGAVSGRSVLEKRPVRDRSASGDWRISRG
jgi:two-component system, NtrC family, sensor kinase